MIFTSDYPVLLKFAVNPITYNRQSAVGTLDLELVGLSGFGIKLQKSHQIELTETSPQPSYSPLPKSQPISGSLQSENL